MRSLSPARSFRIRYFIGLGAIALLVAVSYVGVHRIIEQQLNFSQLIDLASHQAGHANRIAYFASLMATTTDKAEFDTARAQVGHTIGKMRRAHAVLRHGDAESGIPRVTNEQLELIYEDPMVGLDLAVERFLARAETVYASSVEELHPGSAAYIYLTTYGPHILEPLFDAAVGEYRAIGEASIQGVENFELGVLGAVLLALVIEAWLIFYPLERRIRDTIRSLQEKVTEVTETREQLVAAQQLAHVGDWQWNLETDEMTWSDEVYRIYGVDPATFTPGMGSTLRLIHCDDRPRVRDALEATRADGSDSRTEFRVIRPDAGERLVFQKTLARCDARGRVVAISGVVQDITERRELSSRLDKLSQNIPGFIYQYHLRADGTSCFPYASQGMVDVFGVAPEQVQVDAARVLAKVHPDDSERVMAEINASAREQRTWNGQFRIGHAVKGVIWVEGHATPEALPDGSTLWHGYISDVTERKVAENHIRELALFDPLTGLANRRLLRERIEAAMAGAAASGEYGAILMLDLDHFKLLNDTRGHDVGDSLLIEVSERLRNAVRHSDVVARHGGDEFVAVVDRLGREEAAARDTALEVAQKICTALHAPYMLTGAANPYHASASIGVALYRGGHHGVDELLKHADVAMFEAKELGRNRVCMFSTQRQAAIDSRTALTDALRGALERDELRLHYQPQVAASGELVGAEALLRWLPAGGAAISPGSFIPVAEESGLILPIGAWVLETACRHIQQLEFCQPSERFAVAVNISPRQFSDAGLLDNVKAVLEKTGVNPRRLKLEVTESSLFEDRRRATRILQALRDLGVRIELDDFGTGYSSLISLKKLPLDTLKLDGSLIKDLDNESGSAIVRAAIAMGKALGLSIVAEGVETVEQRNYLTRQDCDVLQGFLFARPMPFEALEPLVAQRHVYRGKPGPLSAAAFDERHIA